MRERGNTMFEKVNPCHPDKVADRIAGALVDLAYKKAENPRIAVEVLIGHGVCHIIAETSVMLDKSEVVATVHRIAGNLTIDYVEVPQNGHLADNQADGVRCGDNGIFKGMPVTVEQKKLSQIARDIFAVYPYDGKYILDGDRLILCQSNAETQHLREIYPDAEINPIGDWTGGTDVDTGATNRKLGSDMPYDVWERQGFLQTTEGNVVHYGYIEKFIESLGERFNIREIAFDRWGAVQMVQNLEGMGFTVVPFGQGFKDMSPPTKELMKLVLEQRIAHGGHPVLRWMMDNIFIRTDPAGNIKPDKEKSTEKIDGAVATIMALDRCIRKGGSTGSVYDYRGLIVF